jgi:hypothetical protein
VPGDPRPPRRCDSSPDRESRRTPRVEMAPPRGARAPPLSSAHGARASGRTLPPRPSRKRAGSSRPWRAPWARADRAGAQRAHRRQLQRAPVAAGRSAPAASTRSLRERARRGGRQAGGCAFACARIPCVTAGVRGTPWRHRPRGRPVENLRLHAGVDRRHRVHRASTAHSSSRHHRARCPAGSGDALALIAFAPSKVDRETRILYREDSVRGNRKMRT